MFSCFAIPAARAVIHTILIFDTVPESEYVAICVADAVFYPITDVNAAAAVCYPITDVNAAAAVLPLATVGLLFSEPSSRVADDVVRSRRLSRIRAPAYCDRCARGGSGQAVGHAAR